ncbi:MAG: butyrate kinase, partial [Caldisericaceae bacterium]
RSGNIPNIALVDLCFSGKYSREEILKMLAGKGGLVSHLGTNSLIEVTDMIENGNTYASLVFEAMCYQIAKEIGMHAAVLKGKVDGIVLTGGLANSLKLVEKVKEYVSFIAPVYVYAGEHEMEALAKGVLRVARGEEKSKIYS